MPSTRSPCTPDPGGRRRDTLPARHYARMEAAELARDSRRETAVRPVRSAAMTTQNSTADADRALKAKHRAMWAQGAYPSVASEVIPELGAVLVEACDVRPGQRVLDVGAGSGNAAIPAALAGADVVASDLTPELFEAGRR